MNNELEVIEKPYSAFKLTFKQRIKCIICAWYATPGTFVYTGNWPKKEELVIEVRGLFAHILGIILRARN